MSKIFKPLAAEYAIIGGILVDPVQSLYIAGQHNLRPDWFCDPVNAKAMEVIDAINSAGGYPGLIQVIDRATLLGITAITHDHLNRCIDACGNISQTLPNDVQALRDQYMRRRLRMIGGMARELAESDFEKSADAIMGDVQQEIIRVSVPLMRQRNPKEIYADIVNTWENKAKRIAVPDAVESRWGKMQEYIGGYRNGKIYTVGADPGNGKSTFAGNEALCTALGGMFSTRPQKAVAIASLEMREDEFRSRMLADHADLNGFCLDTGRASESDIATARAFESVHAALPIHVNDSTNDVDALCSWFTAMKAQHDIALAVLDYLQIVTYAKRTNTRNDEVAKIMGILTRTFKKINVPLILLSQLSRDPAKKGSRPTKRDFRDSGAIEADSYGMIAIHEVRDSDGNVTHYEQIILKNRGGPTGTVESDFQKNRQRFVER